MKLAEKPLYYLVLLLPLIITTGCTKTVENNYASTGSGNTLDTDGDGLSDSDEITLYRTSPYISDSDGDGLSDYREVIDLAFNPNSNNYRFNPLIADVPSLGIEITSAPDIDLNYTTQNGASATISTQRTDTTATSVTSSTSTTQSTSVEETHTAGGEVTVGYGTTDGFSAEGTVSYEYSTATTSEESLSWSKEQSKENSLALSQGQEFQESNSVTESDGSMGLSVRIINNGAQPFTVKNLALGSVMRDGTTSDAFIPVANLNYDTQYLTFPEFSLAAGERSGNIVFNTAPLDLGTFYEILGNSTGLVFDIASHEIVDAGGVPFAFNQTDINSKNAQIIIDYADLRKSEKYLISTVGAADSSTISVYDALSSILRVNINADTAGLTTVRDITANPNDAGVFWMAIHLNSDGLSSTTTLYDNLGPTAANPDAQLMSLDALQTTQLAADDILHSPVAAFGQRIRNYSMNQSLRCIFREWHYPINRAQTSEHGHAMFQRIDRTGLAFQAPNRSIVIDRHDESIAQRSRFIQ